MKNTILRLVLYYLIVIILILTSCSPAIPEDSTPSGEEEQVTVVPEEKEADEPSSHALAPGAEGTSMPDSGVSLSETLLYPWDEMNTFFGWSIIGKDKISYVQDLDMKWASLQPHIIWFEIEQEKGKYDWTKLDEEIKWLQELNVDITLVYSTFCNTYDENIRKQIREELLALVKQPDIATISDAWITWNRDLNGPERYGLEPDPFDEEDTMMADLLEFTRVLTERYDGDGTDDWAELKYPLRVHHIGEEWPNPGMNVKTYLGYLAKLSTAIKEADPNAKVMIPGLFMPNWGRIFAYLDGYIEDPDAGIVNGVKYNKSELSQMQNIIFSKKGYESILNLGQDYFDLVDVHLYTEKETFYEGEIEYIKSKMNEFGYQKPIWCVEGGGPFRNPESSPNDPQGDALFGTTDEKEVAEYVVKFHAMSAAKGLIRQHWGIGGQSRHGYWGGPWNIMSLLEKVTQKKRPAYYTYKIMREKLRDFQVGNVADLSIGSIKIFEFTTQEGNIYVAWDRNGSESFGRIDLSDVFGNREVAITQIVTALNDNDSPVIPEVKTYSATSIPLSITPVFIE